MSNSVTFEDFYQVPDLTFDVNKLRSDLEKILKKSKYQTLGITNFHAIPMNKIPGDNSSIEGHNVRGVYWTKPDSSGKEVMRDKPIDEVKYTELINDFKNTYFDLIEAYNWLKKQKGLLALVSILSIGNFLWGFTSVLIPPMILSFTDARGLGIVESSVGLAFLVGSIISLRLADKLQGNLKVAIYMGLLGGLSLILGSLRPSIFLLCIHGIIAGVSGTVQYTVSSGAWLAITTEEIRGRALALRGTVAQMLRPLGVVIAGPLGDYLEFSFYPQIIVRDINEIFFTELYRFTYFGNVYSY